MVGRNDLQSGIALNSMLNSGSRLLGPAAAGIALVQFGAAWCFFLNGLSFLAVLVSLFIMDVPFAITQARHAAPLRQLKEGLILARRDTTIAPLLLLTAQAGLFGIPVISLLPAFAAVVLNSPEEGYAALAVGQGVGSVLAGLAIGWMTHRLGRGWLIAVMVGLTSAATFVFAQMTTIPAAVFASTLSGFFLVSQVVSVNTLIQHTVPDEFRGRVMSLYSLAFFGLAPFGALLLGLIANEIGTPAALSIYAILSALMGGFILLRWPALLRHR